MSDHKDSLVGKNRRIIIVSAAVLILIFIVCLGLGSFRIPVVQTAKIIITHLFGLFHINLNLPETWTDKMETVIITVRFPRILAAGLVGASLALSGAVYQGIFKNPLVSPDLLGVSNGACVGAAVSILLGYTGLVTQFSALVTGIVSVMIAALIPRFFRNSSSLMLVLAGVIVSGFMSSLLGITKYVADPDDQLASIVFWTMGSFSTIRLRDVLIVLPAIAAAMVVVIIFRWRINILSLGDNEAKSMGINIKATRGILIVCSTILTACAICLSGTIGWVGLIIPHLGRLVIGQDNRFLIPTSGIFGAIFMIVVDTIARNLAVSEIPISILTGILGAPLFMILLARQKARID